MPDINKLQKRIGYEFRDEGLLRTALTHSSYASEHRMGYYENNERLEFIGDAFVDAVVGVRLFEILDKSHEGVLSRYRADVVCEESLADAAEQIGLGKFLYLGKGEDAGGGRRKPSILSDAFEALMGAIILDGGYEACRDVILDILEKQIELAADGRLSRDYKSRLQEHVQEKDNTAKISYRIIDEQGPDHNKTFTVSVLINNKVCGTGKGTSRARAEQAAAMEALSKGVL